MSECAVGLLGDWAHGRVSESSQSASQPVRDRDPEQAETNWKSPDR